MEAGYTRFKLWFGNDDNDFKTFNGMEDSKI